MRLSRSDRIAIAIAVSKCDCDNTAFQYVMDTVVTECENVIFDEKGKIKPNGAYEYAKSMYNLMKEEN